MAVAKRTYHDGNGYKRKRRKRGQPEFSTIEAYNEWLSAKRKAGQEANLKKTTKPESEPQENAAQRLEIMFNKAITQGSPTDQPPLA